MQVKTILSRGVLMLATLTLTTPVTAQPVPARASSACTQRTAEAMTVATRDIQITGAGPVDPENGVRTLFMRNSRTGQTAECRVNTIDGYVLSVTLTSQNRPPQPQRPSMNDLVNACIQRTAEEMVVATRDIEMVSAGPVNAENGVRTLYMRNRRTGQRAECRVGTIDGKVVSVTLTQNRPPQGAPPTASVNACIQRTAEEMVVATRDIEMVSAGPVNTESGARTLFMRNRRTGQQAECRVNTVTHTVLSVRLIR